MRSPPHNGLGSISSGAGPTRKHRATLSPSRRIISDPLSATPIRTPPGWPRWRLPPLFHVIQQAAIDPRRSAAGADCGIAGQARIRDLPEESDQDRMFYGRPYIDGYLSMQELYAVSEDSESHGERVGDSPVVSLALPHWPAITVNGRKRTRSVCDVDHIFSPFNRSEPVPEASAAVRVAGPVRRRPTRRSGRPSACCATRRDASGPAPAAHRPASGAPWCA